MRSSRTLPSLREAIENWRDTDQFFFLRKYLDDMREAAASRGAQPAQRRSSLLSRFVQVGEVLLRFCVFWLSCANAPRGRTLVFNHTARHRRSTHENYPLYLDERFDAKALLVVDDASNNLKYSHGVRTLDAATLNRVSSILAAIVVRLYRRHPTTADRDITEFYLKRTFWLGIFRLLRPASIRVFVWYGKEAIISAAKSLAIDVADTQHGIIYRTHPFYGISNVYNNERAKCLLPESVLVYGQYWKDLLVGCGWSDAQVKVIGYFLDNKRYQSRTIEAPYILYTSQPPKISLIREHIRSIAPIVSERGWKIVIALHPLDEASSYDDLLSGVVHLVAADSYDLLRDCAVHVSVSSTLMWEAMLFDKSTYALDYGNHEVDLLTDFVDFGFGRPLAMGQFPEPFSLPTHPRREYFFSPEIDYKTFDS